MRLRMLLPIMLLGCDQASNSAYTLYRNSPIDAAMRIHVASFDSSDGDRYNNENCALAATLFQQQPNITTRFWCEKGTFKK